MKIIDQNLHLIDNALDQAAGVAQEITKAVEGFLVLAYVGVTATIQDSVNGFRNNA